MFGPEGPDGAEPLRQLLSQHAATLVNGLLTACTASCDMGLSPAVQEAAAAMCHCAPEYLPELLTDRWVMVILCQPAQKAICSMIVCSCSDMDSCSHMNPAGFMVN